MSRPRVAPSPCGSGISVRRLPEPTFTTVRLARELASPLGVQPAHLLWPYPILSAPRAAQIIEACQHYEEKCAGQQDAKSPAARCV